MNSDASGSPVRVHVVTASDRASAGVYADLSGPAVAEAVEKHFRAAGIAVSVSREILPDDSDRLAAAMVAAVDKGCRLVVTTGGTGIGPRDLTPEATRKVIEREIPGLMEDVRRRSAENAPGALLSRGVAGIRGQSLIVNLPGSVKAVRECLGMILPLVPHALRMAEGGDHDS